jgi:tetratricopeptide (TPR) repeat protein
MRLTNIIKNIVGLFALTIYVSTLISCKKSWLDAKPDKTLVVPTTVADFQAILDNNTANQIFNLDQPSLSEIGAGDFKLDYSTWQSLGLKQERNAYIWNTDIYAGETGYDWNSAYQRILYANIVLDGVAKISSNMANQTDWDNIKGTALFFRAYDFFNLVLEFGRAYDQGTANTDLGIPLRLTSDINIKYQRASIQETYSQIIADLQIAKQLLPVIPQHTTRAGKCAVYGLLSRVYLHTGQYDKALLYADSCLQLNHELLDFNSLDSTASNPIERFNPEIIYHHDLALYSAFDNNSPALIADPLLYYSYSSDDLRKVIYFKNVSGIVTRNASYSGDGYLFGGLATDEVYLTRAECYARQNNTSAAMRDLNTVLAKRWKTGTFVSYSAASADQALLQILTERRKELVYRGTRWHDLKRLNKEPRFAITLTHQLNGTAYELQPNDPRYVMPIPPDEIRLSGLQQNPR